MLCECSHFCAAFSQNADSIGSFSDTLKMDRIEYNVVLLDNGRHKAVFTVLDSSASSLTENPILCRGAAFHLLVVDVDDDGEGSANGIIVRDETTCIQKKLLLSTIFDSPDPEGTAREICLRLANRLAEQRSHQESAFPTMNGFLGL